RLPAYEPHRAVGTGPNVVGGGKGPAAGKPYNRASRTNPTSTFHYDRYGNLLEGIDPGGYTVTYLFHEVAQTHRIRTSDSFGYVSTAAPNYLFGLPQLITDQNGQMQLLSYDEFGRPAQIFGPNDIGAAEPTIQFAYSQGAPSGGGGLPAYATT